MEAGAFLLLFSGRSRVILAGMLRRTNTTEMEVTNRPRNHQDPGWPAAKKNPSKCLLNKVESIEVSESTIGRACSVTETVMMMIGTGRYLWNHSKKVAHPTEFRSQVQQQIEKLR